MKVAVNESRRLSCPGVLRLRLVSVNQNKQTKLIVLLMKFEKPGSTGIDV